MMGLGYSIEDTLATCAACVPVLIGVFFMWSCTKQPLKIGNNNPVYATIDLTTRESKLMLIWVMHCLFMLGVVAWSFGTLVIGCVEFWPLPPVICVTPPVTALFFVGMYMAIHGEGIVGMPKVYGPPMPVSVMVAVATLILNWNLMRFLTVLGNPVPLCVFYFVTVAFPQLLAYMNRKGLKTNPLFSDIFGEEKLLGNFY